MRAGQSEIHAPTHVGQALRRSARVADRYRRRNREVVAQEMWVRDEAGQSIARSVHHQSFLAEQTSGEVTLRDPARRKVPGGIKALGGAKLALLPGDTQNKVELGNSEAADLLLQAVVSGLLRGGVSSGRSGVTCWSAGLGLMRVT